MDKQKIAAAFRRLEGNVTIGIDGYIDEVWQLVKSRNSEDNIDLYTTMDQYAQRIQQASGGGMAIEIVRKRRSFGGFTANTGNAISKLGVDTTMLSLFGKDTIDPVFEPFGSVCKIISVGDPATTHIFEFDNGKIMMPYEENTNSFRWKQLTDAMGLEKVMTLLGESEIIAFGYWASMPDFDNIITKIISNLPVQHKTRRIFLDFADVRKRDQASLKNVLLLLAKLNATIPMTLSMNEHEAAVIFSLYNAKLNAKQPPSTIQAEKIREQTGLDEIVVHTPYYAMASSTSEGTSIANQNYCQKPVRTAGGGDTFNGGYIASLIAKLPIEERLTFANAVVHCFLSHGHAPSLADVLQH